MKSGFVAGRLSLSEKGASSKIVFLGGLFASDQWLDYLRIIDQLDPNYGKPNATVVALVSSRDVDAVADSASEVTRSSRYNVTQLVDAMALAQRVVQIGTQIFTTEPISSLEKGDSDTILLVNQKVVTAADVLRKQMASRSSVRPQGVRGVFSKDQPADAASVSAALKAMRVKSIISGTASTSDASVDALHSLVGSEGRLVVYESSLTGKGITRHVATEGASLATIPALDLSEFETRTIARSLLTRWQLCAVLIALVAPLIAFEAYRRATTLTPASPDTPLEQACIETGGILAPNIPIKCFCEERDPPYYDPYIETARSP